MAETLFGAAVGECVSQLSTSIIEVIKETKHFKRKLIQLQHTLTNIKPIFKDMQNLNKKLLRRKEETQMFIDQLKKADELIKKCEHIKWNLIKRYLHSLKLNKLNKSLERFFEFDFPLQGARDARETLFVATCIQEIMQNFGGFWRSRAPLLKSVVIGFDEQVENLKRMVLEDSRGGDCSVIVISGGPGCGKTTLATLVCHDAKIKENFGREIYFATISNSTDLKLVIGNLLPMSPAGPAHFSCDNDAIQQWGSFLYTKEDSQVLLVLDDVSDASIIYKFRFKMPGYKILVTSRTTFKQFNTYELLPLKDKDAIELLCHLAISEADHHHDDISKDIVKELVDCCKKHPMALTVVGGFLKGDHVDGWQRMLKKMSQGLHSILDLDLDETTRRHLKTILDFLEDQDRKIAPGESER